MRELGRRLAVAGVGIPFTVMILYLGGWYLTVVIGICALLATRELYALAAAQGVRPFFWIGVPGSLGMVLLAGWGRSYQVAAPWELGLVFGALLLCSALSIGRRWPEGRPVAAVSVTILGILLGGGTLSFAVFLRHFFDLPGSDGSAAALPGAFLVAFPMAVAWLGDTGAYFVGSLYGKRKLIPSVSPGKTVEGGLAGLACAVLVGGIMGWFFLDFHSQNGLSALLGAGLGLVMGVGAQLGDLAESVMKREAGVKDSGDFFPGHGGMLDRFDALFFTVPMAFFLVNLLLLRP
jgi:phosphatidate cytidylyltransferase